MTIEDILERTQFNKCDGTMGCHLYCRESLKNAYNLALEELQSMIDKEYYDGGYGDYHEVETISRMIKKLLIK